MCCQQLKLEIDTHVGLNIEFCWKPIRKLPEWIQNVRINKIDVRALTITTYCDELNLLLQNNRMYLQSVLITLNPENVDLIPALTALSALDKLRVLHINHNCKRYLDMLPISVYRFNCLQTLKIFVHFNDISSFGTGDLFCLIRCPQLQDLTLCVTYELSVIKWLRRKRGQMKIHVTTKSFCVATNK